MYSECDLVLDQACLPSPRELASPPQVIKSLNCRADGAPTAASLGPRGKCCWWEPVSLSELFPPEGAMDDRQLQEMTNITPSLLAPC